MGEYFTPQYSIKNDASKLSVQIFEAEESREVSANKKL
jgi:hypothetical protein